MGMREEVDAEDLRALAARIHKKPDLSKDMRGEHVPPLMYALRKNKLNAAKLLLDAGAPTGLPLAICAGDSNMAALEWLVDHGAQLDAQPGALGRAAAFNASRSVRYLLKQGADPNLADGKGVTPLIRACEQGAFECAKLLLDAGARADPADESGRSATLAACERDGERILALLQKRGLLFAKEVDRKGWSALHYCSVSDQPKSIATLLRAGADVHARTTREHADPDLGYRWPKGGTPLHVAAGAGATAAITALLKAGANTEDRDSDKNTPLLLAALVADVESVDTLLAAGANPNATNKWGWTALHMSSLDLRQRVSSALRRAGADAHVKTSKKWKAYGRESFEAGVTPEDVHHLTVQGT